MFQFLITSKIISTNTNELTIHADNGLSYNKNEPCHEKICLLHMRKQRCRSAADPASLFSLHSTYISNFKPLSIFYICTTWFVSDLVKKPEYRFSHDAAQISTAVPNELFPCNTCSSLIKVGIGHKRWIFLSIFHKNASCECSLEVPWQGASNEYPQPVFSWRNKQKYLLIIAKYQS